MNERVPLWFSRIQAVAKLGRADNGVRVLSAPLRREIQVSFGLTFPRATGVS